MKHFYCLANGQFLTEQNLKEFYKEDPQNMTFTEYVENCMFRNNGELLTMNETIEWFTKQVKLNTTDTETIIDSTDYIIECLNILKTASEYLEKEGK